MTRGGEGCADLFSLVQGNGLKLHQGRFRLVVPPWEGGLAVKAAQGSGTKPDGLQGALGQHSLIHRLIFKLSCVKSGVGLDDPHGPLPAQDILCS